MGEKEIELGKIGKKIIKGVEIERKLWPEVWERDGNGVDGLPNL